MTLADRASRMLAYVTLQRTRGLLASKQARAMAGFIAIVYSLVAMLIGGMLVLARDEGPHYSLILWSSGNGSAPWNYPALLVSAGWGSLALPFFPTIAMLVVALGVGLGMSVSILLAVRLIRQPRRSLAPPATLGSLAGLTPAMIALVTLGACCSTTAAATAGLGAIAQANGTSIDQLLANNWFIGVFQITVLWVALVAQEQLIAVYGLLLGLEQGADRSAHSAPAPTVRSVGRGALRLVLLVVGIVAALSILVDWMVTSPSNAGVGTWVQWLVALEVPALLAVFAGLFPGEVLSILSSGNAPRIGWEVRAVVFGAGLAGPRVVPTHSRRVGDPRTGQRARRRRRSPSLLGRGRTLERGDRWARVPLGRRGDPPRGVRHRRSGRAEARAASARW